MQEYSGQEEPLKGISKEIYEAAENASKTSSYDNKYFLELKKAQNGLPKFIINSELINTMQSVHKAINGLCATFLPQMSRIAEAVQPMISMATQALANLPWEEIGKQLLVGLEELREIHVNLTILENYWLVIDDELRSEIKNLTILTDESVEKCIINFYTRNKYRNLEKLIGEIEQINLLKPRFHIIQSCLQMTKCRTKKHAYNLVIPALCAQATGIVEEDCYNCIPKDIKNKIKTELKNNDNGVGKIKIVECLLNEILPYKVATAFNRVIVESAFCNGCRIGKKSEDELKKYNKFRPKILHGDSNFLNYGTEKNLIRAWLELAFLSKILVIISKKFSILEIKVK